MPLWSVGLSDDRLASRIGTSGALLVLPAV